MNNVEAKKGFTTFVILVFLFSGIFFIGKKIINVGKPVTPEILEVAVLPEVIELTDTSAKISWGSQESLVGIVYYGLTSDLCDSGDKNCSKEEESFSSTSHIITLNNLIPETKYYFRALSGNVALGKESQTFTTKRKQEISPEESQGTDSVKTVNLAGFLEAINMYNPNYDANSDGAVNSLDRSILELKENLKDI